MPPRASEEKREKIVQLRKDGKTYAEIEDALDVSQWLIARTLKEAGMTRTSKDTSEPTEDVEPTTDPDPSEEDPDPEPRTGYCPHCGATIRVEPEDYPRFEAPCCGGEVEVSA